MTIDDAIRESELRTNVGIATAYEHANNEWKECYAKALLEICKSSIYFSADDVMDVMDKKYSFASTHDLRASGAVMRKAAKAGWIKKTDQYVHLKRPHCHGCPRVVWQSLIVSI